MSNVVEFRRPDPPKPKDDPLYFVTIYPNGTTFVDPNHDEVNKGHAADALLDSAFHVWADYDQCIILLAIGSERTTSIRAPNRVETPAQKDWLRRRLADSFENLTGEPLERPGILKRLRTFLRNIFIHGDDK